METLQETDDFIDSQLQFLNEGKNSDWAMLAILVNCLRQLSCQLEELTEEVRRIRRNE